MADDDRTDEPEPGAPIPEGTIDPALISLRRPAPRLGAIAAAAVLVLCVVLMVRLRHDLAFARAGGAPTPVSVEDLAAGKVAANSWVTFTAPADAATAIRAQASQANPGQRVRPVAGTSDRLWLAGPGDAWGPAEQGHVVSGRLRAMSDVRFGAPVARALAKGAWPRFITGVELARARQASAAGGTVALVDGSTLTVTGDAEVELWLPDPGQAFVVAPFGSRHADAAAWGTALAAASVIAPGTAPISTTDTVARWQVQRPDAVAAVTRAVDDAGLGGAWVEASPVRVRAKWSALSPTADGVNVPARTGAPIPWSAIDVAAVWAPRTMPAGAWVVLTGEEPADYWYLTPLYIALAVLSLLFAWALATAVRRQFFDAPTVRAAKA
jgi:hypothetical protein